MRFSVAALLLVFTPAIAGFQLPSSTRQQNVATKTSLYTLTQDDTRVDEKGLTDEDEAVLFGDPSTRDPPFPGRARKKDRSGNILTDTSKPLNLLDHSSTNPMINKLHTMREQTLQSCPQIWREVAKINPDQTAIIDEHLCDKDKVQLTFRQMEEVVRTSGSMFANMGVTKGTNVAIFAENCARWLMVDHGIQLAGGASAVRGADAPLDELRYIYEHSDSAGMVVLQGPRLLQKLHKEAEAKNIGAPLGLSNAKYGSVKNVILMNKEKSTQQDIDALASELGIQINFLTDILDQTGLKDISQFPTMTRQDLATIVYTSGTTGRPKGVMLTHGNLLHQATHRLAPTKPYEESEPLPNESMVAILPVWHITERTFELWMLSRSCKVVYSSIRTFRNDMAKHKPEWLVLVPRILEKVATGVKDKFSSGSVAVKALSSLFTKTSSSKAKNLRISKGLVDVEKGEEAPGTLEKLASKAIVTALSPLNAVGDKLVWKKVQDGFGGNLKCIICGGSALAGSLETFYETAGLQLLVGYGLTECSPLLAYRRRDANLVAAGCCGKPCTDTEIRVVDPASKATETSDRPSLPIGEVGVVIGRGPQVMKGYYKNPEATAKEIDAYGWFDTGDLGRINPATGDLILTGRAKDTIVLSNGENIEPQPIEDALFAGSSLIEQVMLTGQDGRRLVAIAVLSPTELANAGFLSSAEAERLQEANEVINDPKCTFEDADASAKILNEAGAELRNNKDLQSSLMGDIKQATSKGFRKWEQVGAVHLTLEPFAMVNGQLTQSYKVKRAAVMDRYGDELP